MGKKYDGINEMIKNVEYYAYLFSENSFYPDSTTGNERSYSKSEFVSTYFYFHLNVLKMRFTPIFWTFGTEKRG